jgi:tetratricopeptide (TPR) repeat protein
MRWIFFALLAGPAFAECPAAPEIDAPLRVLINEARTAPDERAARAVTGDMWALWTRAPDARAQALLDEGRARMRQSDLVGAGAVLSELISYCPDYAEGYNQRAFAHFLLGDFALALPDLDAALERSPLHVAAMSGRFLTLRALGREDEAQEVLRTALELNPWLPERVYLSTEH